MAPYSMDYHQAHPEHGDDMTAKNDAFFYHLCNNGPDSSNSGGINQRRRRSSYLPPISEKQVRFVESELDLITLCPVPPLSEYSRKERQSTWYSIEELTAMEQGAVPLLRKYNDRKRRSPANSKHSKSLMFAPVLSLPPQLRGLEFQTTQGFQQMRIHRLKALNAVLREQYEQRVQQEQEQDQQDNGEERIRHAYQTVGGAEQCQEIAVAMAQMDQFYAAPNDAGGSSCSNSNSCERSWWSQSSCTSSTRSDSTNFSFLRSSWDAYDEYESKQDNCSTLFDFFLQIFVPPTSKKNGPFAILERE